MLRRFRCVQIFLKPATHTNMAPNRDKILARSILGSESDSSNGESKSIVGCMIRVQNIYMGFNGVSDDILPGRNLPLFKEKSEYTV